MPCYGILACGVDGTLGLQYRLCISEELVAALSCSLSRADDLLDGDANIHSYAVSALQQLKLRHDAPELYRAPDVCYEDIGCFDRNGTFKHLKQLPEPPEVVGTQFHLYTRRNPWEAQLLDYKDPDSVFNSHIDASKPLKIISHGFGGKNNLTWVWNMKNAFLEMEDVNIIVVDWSIGARVPFYIQACVNAELVGAHTAVMYFFLKDKLGMREKDLHVVGFSLGAQVAGFVGKRMQRMRGTRPARITGLDAASPLFEDYGGDVHLYKDDADFVDVVHTNADLLIYGGVGMGTPIGDLDFYPNGGKRQPGCDSTIKGAFLDIFKGNRERACNHERAVHLYTDAILNPSACRFTGYPCVDYADFERAGECFNCATDGTCGQLGYRDVKGSGIYYLLTKDKEPFCADPVKATVRYSNGLKKSYGHIILTLTGNDGSSENVTFTNAKDERLVSGEEKVRVVGMGESLKPLKSVQALYIKYDGWITKGTPTYSLEYADLVLPDGKTIFKTCGEDIELEDSVAKLLTPCES